MVVDLVGLGVGFVCVCVWKCGRKEGRRGRVGPTGPHHRVTVTDLTTTTTRFQHVHHHGHASPRDPLCASHVSGAAHGQAGACCGSGASVRQCVRQAPPLASHLQRRIMCTSSLPPPMHTHTTHRPTPPPPPQKRMARFFSTPKAGVLLGLVALAAVAPSSEAFCGFLNGNMPRGGAGPLSAKV